MIADENDNDNDTNENHVMIHDDDGDDDDAFLSRRTTQGPCLMSFSTTW